MSRLHIHIDHIVFQGLAPADRHVFLQTLHHELTQSLSQTAAPAQSRTIPVLRLGAVPAASGPAGARRLATQVARAIAQGKRP